MVRIMVVLGVGGEGPVEGLIRKHLYDDAMINHGENNA